MSRVDCSLPVCVQSVNILHAILAAWVQRFILLIADSDETKKVFCSIPICICRFWYTMPSIVNFRREVFEKCFVCPWQLKVKQW